MRARDTLSRAGKANPEWGVLIQTINNLNWTWCAPEPRVLMVGPKIRDNEDEESGVPEDASLTGEHPAQQWVAISLAHRRMVVWGLG
jgi:hypothetical protein